MGAGDIREQIMPAGRFGGGRMRKFSSNVSVISVQQKDKS